MRQFSQGGRPQRDCVRRVLEEGRRRLRADHQGAVLQECAARHVRERRRGQGTVRVPVCVRADMGIMSAQPSGKYFIFDFDKTRAKFA